jgi:hypothetical protein
MFNQQKRRFIYPLFVFFLFALSSCFRAKIDKTQFYVLTPFTKTSIQEIDPPENQASQSKNVRFILGPVTIPNYLERSTIASRKSDNRLHYSESHRWAEPLQENISRVMKENFELIQPSSEIQSIGEYGNRNLKYQLEVHFSQFESTDAGKVLLAARWKLYERKKQKLLMTQDEFFSKEAQNKSMDARVAALSQVLSKLTVKITQTAFQE